MFNIKKGKKHIILIGGLPYKNYFLNFSPFFLFFHSLEVWSSREESKVVGYATYYHQVLLELEHTYDCMGR